MALVLMINSSDILVIISTMFGDHF